MHNAQKMDFYEILEISPNASQETIDRMFRHLAQRYHPDRQSTGDSGRFSQIVEAYGILREPESRAAYDASHKTNVDYQWSLVEEAGDDENFHEDYMMQERVLSVLYTKRKRDPREPGLRVIELERLTSCPREVLEFHLWYLRDKGWIKRTEDDGSMAITADGVDQSLLHRQEGPKRLTNEQ